ncbi:acyltransferase [Mycolicibacterium brumae]|uniref:Acyltransferase n=1 Tax=Mycolicibacterium brumae TaxID=85968 RepID=A0A2G5P9D4_9MYCO|nr:acyltransferase [Mycolicibacterium brumae]RWA22471.1 hypothetical protein MBRU_12885 [Mycolicibacterium brumae DSM 44177]
MPASSISRDGALTGLRAIAAILVIGTHCGFVTGKIPHGYTGNIFARLEIGVPIFFALSGFLLFRPWARAALAGGRTPSTKRYARRRFRRIVPAYVVAVLVTFAFYAVYTGGGENPGQSWYGLLRYLTLTHIYTFDYMATRLHIGLPQMWSLAVEVSFYAILPVLAYLLLRRRDGGARSPAAVLWLIAALALIEPIWLVVLHSTHLLPMAAGMWLPAHLAPFAGGMALVILQIRRAHCRARVALPIAVATFLLSANSLIGGHYLDPVRPWQPIVVPLMYALFATLLLAPLALGDTGWWHRFLSTRPMVFLGEISYEIFLLHIVVMVATMEYVLGWPGFTGSALGLWSLTLLLTIPLAWALNWLTAPKDLRARIQLSSRSAGTSSASARPRCEEASFSAGDSCAADRNSPSGTNTGS